jgi:hypothetical protein
MRKEVPQQSVRSWLQNLEYLSEEAVSAVDAELARWVDGLEDMTELEDGDIASLNEFIDSTPLIVVVKARKLKRAIKDAVNAGENGGDEATRNWFRYSVISLDIVPSALREILKLQWHRKYGCQWKDNGLEGVLFLEGGTVWPCDEALPGSFNADVGHTKISCSQDVTAWLKKGDLIRFDNFETVLSDDPKSAKNRNNHTIPGKLKVRNPVRNALREATGYYSLVRIPAATCHNGRAIPRHVRSKLLMGKLAEMDTTALNFVLLGEKNHALLDRPARQFHNQSAAALLELDLTTSEWVAYLVGLRNAAMAHRTSAQMPSDEYETSCSAIKLFLQKMGFERLLEEFDNVQKRSDFGSAQLNQRWQSEVQLAVTQFHNFQSLKEAETKTVATIRRGETNSVVHYDDFRDPWADVSECTKETYGISAQGADAIADALRETNGSITELDLAGCNLDDEQMTAISLGIPKGLEKLYIGSKNRVENRFRFGGITAVANALAGSSIQLLNISRVCPLGLYQDKEYGAAILHVPVITPALGSAAAKLIPRPTTTTTGTAEMGTGGELALAQALLQSSVSDLAVDGWQLTDEGVTAIVRALPSTMTQLSMCVCSISALGGSAISNALTQSSLTKLWLSYNHIGDEAATAIASALPQSNLAWLTLRDCDIHDDGATAIALALPHCKLSGLCLEENDISGSASRATGKLEGVRGELVTAWLTKGGRSRDELQLETMTEVRDGVMHAGAVAAGGYVGLMAAVGVGTEILIAGNSMMAASVVADVLITGVATLGCIGVGVGGGVVIAHKASSAKGREEISLLAQESWSKVSSAEARAESMEQVSQQAQTSWNRLTGAFKTRGTDPPIGGNTQ